MRSKNTIAQTKAASKIINCIIPSVISPLLGIKNRHRLIEVLRISALIFNDFQALSPFIVNLRFRFFFSQHLNENAPLSQMFIMCLFIFQKSQSLLHWIQFRSCFKSPKEALFTTPIHTKCIDFSASIFFLFLMAFFKFI